MFGADGSTRSGRTRSPESAEDGPASDPPASADDAAGGSAVSSSVVEPQAAATTGNATSNSTPHPDLRPFVAPGVMDAGRFGRWRGTNRDMTGKPAPAPGCSRCPRSRRHSTTTTEAAWPREPPGFPLMRSPRRRPFRHAIVLAAGALALAACGGGDDGGDDGGGG